MGRLMAGVKVDGDSGCWIWTKGRFTSGYGQIWADGKPRRAHRLAWEVFRGEIPEGQHVCHTCDNPPCINPHHLFLGSHCENMRDKVAKGRQPRGEQLGCLTEEEVRSIRADTRKQCEIAADYETTQVNISLIKRRKTWAHVD